METILKNITCFERAYSLFCAYLCGFLSDEDELIVAALLAMGED